MRKTRRYRSPLALAVCSALAFLGFTAGCDSDDTKTGTGGAASSAGPAGTGPSSGGMGGGGGTGGVPSSSAASMDCDSAWDCVGDVCSCTEVSGLGCGTNVGSPCCDPDIAACPPDGPTCAEFCYCCI